MTWLYDPPRPIEVLTDQQGQPTHVRQQRGSWSPVQVIQRWVADVNWWSSPITRDYWRLLVRDQLLVEVFRDPGDDRWYAQRVYD